MKKSNDNLIIAIQSETGRVIHISKFLETGKRFDCICLECDSKLEAVINTERRKHFRHSNKNNCNPSPETQLHLLAKEIIFSNQSIYHSRKGIINYTSPNRETKFENLIPDITINYGDEKIYIEIVVTNIINKEKFEKYKLSNSDVLVINLSEEDRFLSYEELEFLVLKDIKNKSVLDYTVFDKPVQNKEDKDSTNFMIGVVIFILAFICFYWKEIVNFFKRKL